MAHVQVIASIHRDYMPFIKLASADELAQFIRAQICMADGEDIPALSGMAKALFDAHNELIARLEESKRKKSDAGKRGGNPLLKQTKAEVNQCLSTVKAEDKPVSYSVSNTYSLTKKKTTENARGDGGDDLDLRDEEPPEEVREFREVLAATQDCGWSLPSARDEREASECIEEHGAEQTVKAILRAHERGRRTWGYVKGILEDWRAKGYVDDPSAKAQSPPKQEIKPMTPEQKQAFEELIKKHTKEARHHDAGGNGNDDPNRP